MSEEKSAITGRGDATQSPRLSRALATDESFRRLSGVSLPDAALFDLPERVLQFGSGRFLRGFADAFIHEANVQGHFDGRIVIVQGTGRQRAAVINEQDGLYTLCIRGKSRDKVVEEDRVIASVSRAISAKDDWNDVLELARSPQLTHVVSNTTEAGMVFDPDDRADADPPVSFPGKLTAVLYERFKKFNGARDAGLVILPCELVQNNGSVLRDLVLKTADSWALEDGFRRWVADANTFCNSLVDRIVPGSPSGEEEESNRRRFGYDDRMQTVTEVFHLWAIEGPPELGERIPFARATDGIVIAEDIAPFQERKVRILNGCHTASVPAALLCGCDIVIEMIHDEDLSRFIRHVAFEEIIPSLESPPEIARAFASDVLDRFANPFLHHVLKEITLNHLSKVRVRVVPSIVTFAERHGRVPQGLAFGFAATLRYLRDAEIDDPEAAWISTWWEGARTGDQRHRLDHLLRSEALWGRSLASIPGFADAVEAHLAAMEDVGPRAALQSLLSQTGVQTPAVRN